MGTVLVRRGYLLAGHGSRHPSEGVEIFLARCKGVSSKVSWQGSGVFSGELQYIDVDDFLLARYSWQGAEFFLVKCEGFSVKV